MDITIAIVCSTDRLIKKCLQSIPLETPIIAVLNYPDTAVLSIVGNDHRVKLIRHDERNLGKLRQLAVDNCETPAICFIDSDCVLSEGGVKILERELDEAVVVNIPIRYAYNDFSTQVVSQCRKFTTPENLLFMPLAFRLDVQSIIGPFFNKNLKWGEDSDQRKRLKEANIEYVVSKTHVTHKALSILEDSQSAIRLGRGTYIQELNALSTPRNIFKDLSILHEINNSMKCWKIAGFSASVYHFFVWRPSYKYGYWKSRIYGVN